MNPLNTSKFPTLAKLTAEGKVWIEDSDYVGTAADGTVVSLGTVGFAKECENYLKSHPTPDTW